MDEKEPVPSGTVSSGAGRDRRKLFRRLAALAALGITGVLLSQPQTELFPPVHGTSVTYGGDNTGASTTTEIDSSGSSALEGNSTASAIGVLGVTQGAAPGAEEAGVVGAAVDGDGVIGVSGSGTGVVGQSTDSSGVSGSGGTTGVSGTGPTGVYGTSSSSNIGVVGATEGTAPGAETAGVVGIADRGDGVIGLSTLGQGIVGESDYIGVVGVSPLGTSYVDTLVGVLGVAGSGAVGVQGQAGNYTAIPIVAVGASGQTAPLQEWQNSSGTALSVVDPNGRVGIGTNAPLNPLDVVGAAAVGTYAGVNTAPANGLIVSGNVGIGTPTPEAPLTVVSPTTITAALIGSTQGNLIFAKSGTNGFSMYSNAANYLGFYSNDSGLQPLTMNGSGIAVGNAYRNTAPPTNGAIIQGDVGIGTSSPAHLIQLSGGAYSDGTNWTNASDKNLKEDFTAVDEHEILERLETLPIQKWRYKNDKDSVQHVGPVAQDFYTAYQLGNDDKSISTVDTAGIAFAAIKALKAENNSLRETLQTENKSLRERIEALERKLAAS